MLLSRVLWLVDEQLGLLPFVQPTNPEGSRLCGVVPTGRLPRVAVFTREDDPLLVPVACWVAEKVKVIVAFVCVSVPCVRLMPKPLGSLPATAALTVTTLPAAVAV